MASFCGGDDERVEGKSGSAMPNAGRKETDACTDERPTVGIALVSERNFTFLGFG